MSVATMVSGLRGGLDRALSVGYGTVYDFIFEHFKPYHDLRDELLEIVEASAPVGVARHDVRALEIGCGPGNFAFTLAGAGFSVVGIDAYDALVELAREKRRASHCPHVAFQHSDLTTDRTFADGSFDEVICIHSLYVHPRPDRLLADTHRVLKPGGHAIFVNHTRRIPLCTTLRDLVRRDSLTSALRSLLWLLPNAIFEVFRKRNGPHYWPEAELRCRLEGTGFEIVQIRRTFFDGTSLLAWARKPARAE